MSKWFNVRQECPVCKSSHKMTLLVLPYDETPVRDHLESWYSCNFDYIKGGHYILDECKTCGLIYQREILNEEGMSKLYNEWIDYKKVFEKNLSERTSDRGLNHAKELANIFMYFDAAPGKLKLLDFGMGFGTWCYLAKGFGCFDIYGTEISQIRMDYASGINIIAWEDLPNYQFDFINTEQVFEHLPNPRETLLHLGKALAPNGVIKISVPNGKHIVERLKIRDWEALKEGKIAVNSNEIWEDGIKNSLNPVAPLEHINCFNHDVLISMANRFGFSKIDIPNKRVVVCTDRYGIKNIFRPYYHLLANLLPLKIKARNETSLFFKKTRTQNF